MIGLRRASAAAGLALCMSLLGLALPAGGQIGSQPRQVQVRDNAFEQKTIKVSPGETIRWTSTDSNGHTVTADNGEFNFHPGGKTLARGESVEWTVPSDAQDGYVDYSCLRHGLRRSPDFPCGMCGTIVVGDPPPRPDGAPPPPRPVPSLAYPTIASALLGAPRGTVVELAPGDYAESVTIGGRGLTIRGTGATPADVRIASAGQDFGLVAFGDDASVENLTVEGFGRDGILVVGERFTAREVVTTGNGQAGVRVEGCEVCSALLASLTATGNGVGVRVVGGVATVVSGSSITGNGSGVVLVSGGADAERGRAPSRQLGSHVVGNVIEDNNAATDAGPSGVGVWLAGGSFNVVEGNRIAGHDAYGVAVSWLWATSDHNRVVGNVVSASGRADLAYDGLGASTCFSGNRRPDGTAPSTEPDGDLPDCGGPAGVGAPWLPLTAAMLTGSPPS